MRYKLALLALVGGVLVLSEGCASIVNRPRRVNITSEPTGAAIRILNKKQEVVYEGTTPAKVPLKRYVGYFSAPVYKVEFKKAGCRDCSAEIKRGVSGWYIAGNFFFGGLIGYLVVDPLTGAMWTLKDLHMTLEPGSSAESDTGLRILALDQVPPELHDRLVRID